MKPHATERMRSRSTTRWTPRGKAVIDGRKLSRKSLPVGAGSITVEGANISREISSCLANVPPAHPSCSTK